MTTSPASEVEPGSTFWFTTVAANDVSWRSDANGNTANYITHCHVMGPAMLMI